MTIRLLQISRQTTLVFIVQICIQDVVQQEWFDCENRGNYHHSLSSHKVRHKAQVIEESVDCVLCSSAIISVGYNI